MYTKSIIRFIVLLISFTFLKEINAQPGLEWASVYNSNGLSTVNKVAGMKVDSAGNVYVAGYGNFGGLRKNEGIIVKYNSAGNILWTAVDRGQNDSLDEFVNCMIIDNKGNVYISGERTRFVQVSPKGGVSYSDFFTAKFSSNGNLIWDRTYDRSDHDWGVSMDVDNSGNIFVLGTTRDANSRKCCTTIKYDSNGVLQWANHYKLPGIGDSSPIQIKIDKNSNSYILATDVASNYDFVTVKYNSNGVLKWNKRYDDGSEVPTCIEIDNSGNIFVAGSGSGIGTGSDFLTVKYDSLGNVIWGKKNNLISNSSDQISAIALDSSGNCYVTGSSYYSLGTPGYDYVTIKYGSGGDSLWTKIYDGNASTGSKADKGYTINLDRAGNIYVTGISYPGLYGDYLTVKYNSAGSYQWEKRYHGINIQSSVPVSSAIDKLGNVYVSGTAQTAPNSYNFLTVKYSPLVSVNTISNTIPDKFSLYQNYPNPFNPSTNIRFNLPAKNFTTLKIFDLTGNEVCTLISDELSSGEYNIQWNAAGFSSGIYFCTLSSGSFIETNKLILIK